MFQRLVSSFKAHVLPAITTLGVVYGDIGTSPLYAVKEINHHLGEAGRDPHIIFGYISLVIWTLLVIIAIKYIVFVLRADNNNEGGVFALFALISEKRKAGVATVSVLLLLSVGFLFGDGMITPAISVLSAIEGLSIVTSAFTPYVVPITIGILIALFVIQSQGTAKIGILFGPIIAFWFICLLLLGLSHIFVHPEILQSLNPVHALTFVSHQHIGTLLLVLGSVMLVVTGGEALYADMGHFGKKPIQQSWFALVFPALVINYLGQGAFLLGDTELINHNVFFSMVPEWALIPMVVLATLSTVIASQALITGAFSLVSQAISMGYLPFMKITHTHEAHVGQIYIPFVNYAILAGCIGLVLQFQSSTNLASAYGLAVSYVMLVTTCAITLIARYLWNWSKVKTILIFVPFLVLDLVFLTANSVKFLSGGYIPFLIGLFILVVMYVWRWGKKSTRTQYQRYSTMTVEQLVNKKRHATAKLPKSFIIMTPDAPKKLQHKLPLLGEVLLDRYGILPKHLIFVTVNTTNESYVKENKFTLTSFYKHPQHGSISSVRLNYGFMERITLEKDLLNLAKNHTLSIDRNQKNWLIHVTHSRFFRDKSTGFLTKIRIKIYQFLHQNSISADDYFNLGKETKLAVEVLPIRL